MNPNFSTMEEMKSLTELFPDLFELESKDREWYQSIKLSIPNCELEMAAQDFAYKSIIEPDDNIEAVEDCIRRFKDGAYWCCANFGCLQKLSVEKFEKAIDIAVLLYSKEQCKFIELEENNYFSESDALDLMEVIQDEFKSGIEWVIKTLHCN